MTAPGFGAAAEGSMRVGAAALGTGRPLTNRHDDNVRVGAAAF
jgi:hypothetical protein